MEKSFFSVLFDSSFSDFITRRVAKILYAISMGIVLVLVMLGVIFGVFALTSSNGSSDALLSVLIVAGSPIAGFLALVIIRLGFESSVALVLVAENTRRQPSKQSDPE